MKIYKSKIIFIVLVFFSFLSCEEDLPPSIKINKEIFSVDDQKELGAIFVEKYANDNPGKVLDREIYKQQYKYIESFNLFVTEQVSRREIFDWDLSIVLDDSRNIFCFPGGHFYITTGLLKFIENESQLVGILANEIYYSESDILVNMLVRKYNGVSLGDIFLGREPEKFTTSEITAYLIDVKFEIRDVLQADKLGLEIVCNFEYHAMSISEFIEEAEVIEDFVWLDRHPTSEERILGIKSVVENNDCNGLLLYKERYSQFKTTLP